MITLSKYKRKKHVKDALDRKWYNEILTYPKAEGYVCYKTNINFEFYLKVCKNRKERVMFTKLRLSDHCLQIEKGRHCRPKIPREQRYCDFCTRKIEDEIHFVSECRLYEGRELLFDYINDAYPNFKNLSIKNKFIFLMSQTNADITKKITKLICTWMEKRLDNDQQC